VKRKVFDCARHAAAAVGATVELVEGLEYAERRINLTIAERFRHHLESFGESVQEPLKTGGVGSSDFGNLSQKVPAIHPYIAIVPEGISAHTREFAEAAGGPAGLRAMILAARCLALTGADLMLDPDLLRAVKAEFEDAVAA
jgi:metal-dependent amidase/aminoacylase/carboxypeptidase family protein